MIESKWQNADTGFISASDTLAANENCSSSGSGFVDPVSPTCTSTPPPILNEFEIDSPSSSAGAIEELKHRPAFCLFVASLSAQRNDDELCQNVRAHFAEYGYIISVKVLRDPKNRPYAFVQYGNEADTENALKKGHRSTLDGRELRCEPARVNRTILVCSDYPDERVSYSLATELSVKYGEVENITNFDGTPGGGMFIRFAFRDDAARAFTGMQQETHFRVFWVQNVATSKPQREYDPNQLFVGQLPSDIAEEDIRSKFSKFGAILNVEIIRKSKHADVFAFIQFDNYMATVQAIERLNHTAWKGRNIHVQCREERKVRAQLAPPPSHIQVDHKMASRYLNNKGQQHHQPRYQQTQNPHSYQHQHQRQMTSSAAPNVWRKDRNKENLGPKGEQHMRAANVNEFYPYYYYQMPWGVYPTQMQQQPQDTAHMAEQMPPRQRFQHRTSWSQRR